MSCLTKSSHEAKLQQFSQQNTANSNTNVYSESDLSFSIAKSTKKSSVIEEKTALKQQICKKIAKLFGRKNLILSQYFRCKSSYILAEMWGKWTWKILINHDSLKFQENPKKKQNYGIKSRTSKKNVFELQKHLRFTVINNTKPLEKYFLPFSKIFWI